MVTIRLNLFFFSKSTSIAVFGHSSDDARSESVWRHPPQSPIVSSPVLASQLQCSLAWRRLINFTSVRQHTDLRAFFASITSRCAYCQQNVLPSRSWQPYVAITLTPWLCVRRSSSTPMFLGHTKPRNVGISLIKMKVTTKVPDLYWYDCAISNFCLLTKIQAGNCQLELASETLCKKWDRGWLQLIGTDERNYWGFPTPQWSERMETGSEWKAIDLEDLNIVKLAVFVFSPFLRLISCFDVNYLFLLFENWRLRLN